MLYSFYSKIVHQKVSNKIGSGRFTIPSPFFNIHFYETSKEILKSLYVSVIILHNLMKRWFTVTDDEIWEDAKFNI